MHLSITSLIHCLYRCVPCSLLFIYVPYFNNGVSIYVCHFGRLESLLNEMQFHDLNESYDSCKLARPAVSPLERLARIDLARTFFTEMEFHQIKRHVIFMKSITHHLHQSFDSYESNPRFHDSNKW